jgi:hypothetical protein
MTGLGPVTHDFADVTFEDVGGRAEPGHDTEVGLSAHLIANAV